MSQYFLEIKKDLEAEITHLWDFNNNSYIFSKSNLFWGSINGKKFRFYIEINFIKKFFLKNRLIRRALRYDKSNAILNFKKDGIIVIYRSQVYFYSLKKRNLEHKFELKNCRNLLHNSICVIKKGIFFGEYGSNKSRSAVPIYGSYDDGRNWETIYQFPRNSIKHIHGIYFDKFTNSLYIPTGDFSEECFIAVAQNLNFSKLEIIGNGQQKYRCVSMFFKKR